MEINGRFHQLSEPMTLAELLALAGYESRPVAVMLNDQIIPQTDLSATQVGDADRLEVVSFVGGGQP
ncbi:MAG: sulfur carrier protein ThiS [Candidatus Adiutrix sp.]|jgi:thiamine biosynthesis protein ThiS|nr:sulfur carrier protein ThiS [Candidatus Adiutrix sp.]